MEPVDLTVNKTGGGGSHSSSSSSSRAKSTPAVGVAGLAGKCMDLSLKKGEYSILI